ncbi:hypothetical protein [Anaerostipes hadrus]|nr:hypothetical protein [Anaerostipes hadrus]
MNPNGEQRKPKSNPNIQWQLDEGGTWEDLMKNIKALSAGSSDAKEYAPN